MASSTIEWTEATWNPVAGCTILSPGCTNCYAMRMAARLEAMGTTKYDGLTRKSGGRAKWTGAVTLDRDALGAPATWRKPRMIFVNSMSDLFHKDVPDEFIARVCDTMERAHWHTFQILTKRSSLMRHFLRRRYGQNQGPSHMWFGVSVEDGSKKSKAVNAARVIYSSDGAWPAP